MDAWLATSKKYKEDNVKFVYYMSMEFLMGRALGNNIINLCAEKEIREVLDELGIDLNVAAMGYLRFCFVVLIEAIRVILISRQRVSNRSYSAEERIFVFPNSSNQ